MKERKGRSTRNRKEERRRRDDWDDDMRWDRRKEVRRGRRISKRDEIEFDDWRVG